MADSIFGFGGVKIGTSGDYVVIPSGFGTVSYTPKYREFEADNGYITRDLKGYRVTVDIELWNIDSTDAANAAELIRIINEHNPVGVMPRIPTAAAGVEYLVIYPCNLTSSFSPKDLAKFEVGQSLNLTFEKNDLSSAIPAIFTSSTTPAMAAEDDNTLITESGDTLILFEG